MAIKLSSWLEFGESPCLLAIASPARSIVFTHEHVCQLRNYSPYSQRYATPYFTYGRAR